jgi:phage repressor protein C with HTH and peptisase S24 domain
MNKYLFLMKELETKGHGKMTVFGNSMLPLIKSGETLTFKKQEQYEVDDVVFCKVRGRYIDAHKVLKKNPAKGYLIGNNHGWENGWTKTIYGKVDFSKREAV